MNDEDENKPIQRREEQGGFASSLGAACCVQSGIRWGVMPEQPLLSRNLH